MKNLLLQLQGKKEEDFWTEAFGHLLEYLIKHDYTYARELLWDISQEKFDLSIYKPADVKIWTQHRTNQGITDIEINAPDFCVVIENKVEAGLSRNQIENYQKYLDNLSANNNLVILLSKYSFRWKESEKVVTIRWFDVCQYLEEINQKSLSPVSHFLLSQFLGFVKEKGQCVDRCKEGLANSIAFIRQQNDLKLIKSFDKLKTKPELKPLYEFWILVWKAAKNVRPNTNIKLGSGKTSHAGSGWIALNFDKADIFCAIYFNEPNKLVFETYQRKIDVDRITSIGTWTLFQNNRKCKTALNLIDEKFFIISEVEQLKCLEEFLRKCYADLGEPLQ